MKNLTLLLLIIPFMVSCKGQEKIDLSTLKLTEKIESVLDFDEENTIGVETMEYPFCLILEIEKSKKYTFEGIDLSNQKILFQINSERLKTDSITRFGGAHYSVQSFSDKKGLSKILKEYKADNQIYGVRISLDSPKLKNEILNKLINKYGKGIKNPTTDNGLYWNIKKENKFIFFAPDYDRLIILNNTNLSKTCYWDTVNGFIDFGGCNNEEYTKDLMKNATKPADVNNKPEIVIDKNWNINGLEVGKSTENDFVNSSTFKGFEKIQELDSSTGDVISIFYRNEYHDYYFDFDINKKNPDLKSSNIISRYSVYDFEKVTISFENGMKVGMKFDDIIKLLDKKSILNYENLQYETSIKIKKSSYITTLNFDDKMQFSGMYMNKDEQK